MVERISIRLGNLTLKQMGIALVGFILVIAVIAQVEKVSRESRLEDERNAPYIAKERLVAREEAARKAEVDERWKTTEAGRLCAEHPAWTHDDCDEIVAKKIHIGMTEEQVIAAWQHPYKINRTTYPDHTTEQWVMYEGGDTYLYFDDGVLRTIQQPSE